VTLLLVLLLLLLIHLFNYNCSHQGAKVASSAKEVAENSDIVFSIVGFPTDVEAVFDGVLDGLRAGGIFVDMTTSDPSLAAAMHAKGVKCDIAKP
jgi:3-hydroxyisobutyrate dehydrogenase-like beta-hydroxyacid dehydrogenase